MRQAGIAEDRKRKSTPGPRNIVSLSVLVLGGLANMLWIALLAWLFCGLIYGAVTDYL
jgi:hypothetical protein